MIRMIRQFVTGVAILACIAVAGCANKQISDRDLAIVTTDEAVTLVGHHDRLFGLGGSRRGAWVDPRNPDRFRSGHIPGAINVPISGVREDSSVLRNYDILVVYGDGYGDDVAAAMSKTLMELGFGDVRTLRGGLRAWTDAGNEVATLE